jgi:regulator of protease activity HflC (stomatin/prohibitin superfamily)
MDDEDVLGHLLKIEAEAAALVNEAQAEAERRIADGEKQNRGAYEERFRAETAEQETEYQKAREQVKARYQKELEAYREKLDANNADMKQFSVLLNTLLAGEG